MSDILIKISEFNHCLTESDFEKLADMSEKYSSADIHAICKDLHTLRWPLLDQATHFKVHLII